MSNTEPDCQRIRDEFSALLDGELSTVDRDRVEDHLSDCAECLRALNKFKRVDDAFARLRPVPAPEGFDQRVRLALKPPAVRRFHYRGVAGAIFAAAAAVAVVATIWPRAVIAPGDGSFQVSRSMEGPTLQKAKEIAAEETMRFDGDVASENQPVSMHAAETAASERPQTPETEPHAAKAEAMLLGNARPEGAVANHQTMEPGSGDDATPRMADPEIKNAETLGDSQFAAQARSDSDSNEVEQRETLVARQQPVPPAPASPEPMIESESANRVTGAAGDYRESTAGKPEDDADMLASTIAPAERVAEESAAPAGTRSSAQKADPTESADELADKPVPRVFEVREGVWYEKGYSGEQVLELDRDGERLKSLLENDPALVELAANESRIVFRVDSVWYALPAVR